MKQSVKREKEENWKKAVNFIPKKDEVILYDCKDGVKIKIGDGFTKVNDLNFIDETQFACFGSNFIVKEE